jgi:type I restriction enzyme M protein
MQKRFFPEGKDSKKRSFQDYRWNRFKNTDPRDMYAVVSEHVFPWLRTLGGNGTTYSKQMEGALRRWSMALQRLPVDAIRSR